MNMDCNVKMQKRANGKGKWQQWLTVAFIAVFILFGAVSASAEEGSLTYMDKYASSDNINDANFVTVSPDGNNVYVTGQNSNSVAWFTRNGDGSLTYTGKYQSVDNIKGPFSVTVSPDGNNVYVVGAFSDSVAWFTRNGDGSLSYAGKYESAANIHVPVSVAVSPDGNNVYVAAMFISTVAWFTRNSDGSLSYTGKYESTANIGDPDSVTVSPDGNNVYVAGSDIVAWFTRNDDGSLTYAGKYESAANIGNAESVTVSPDGNNVYVAARYLSNSVAWFTRNGDGSLTYTGKYASSENIERAESVTVSPDGNNVYVAASYSSSVAWFTRNSDGSLTYTGKYQNGPNIGGAISVSVSPDGNNVYVAGEMENAVAWFQRENWPDEPEPVAYPALEDTQSIMLNDSPIEGFQSSAYMGSITQSISIFAPSGTGGLQPNIALTYNSQSADQIGIHQQAGVAGLGWSISGISYIYIKDGKDPASTSDDIYGLSFGGTSYELEEDKDVNNKYHTIPESYLKILDKGTYWEVTDKSGTFHQFGKERNSRYYDKDNDGFRWNIDMVRDTSGNEMYFNYDRTISGGCTQSGRIASIKYTYRSGAAVGNLRQVIFSYGNRNDIYEWNKSEDAYGIFYETKKLEKITVQVGTSVVKEYNFGYDYSSDYVEDNVKIGNGDFETADTSGGFFGWTEVEDGSCHVEWYGNSSDWKAQLNGNGNLSYGHAMVYQTQDIYSPYSMLSFEAQIDGDTAFPGLIVSIDDDDNIGDAPFADFVFPETDGGWHTYYIPLNMFVGENRRIRFYVYDQGNDNTEGYAIIDNVKVGSGPYLTLTSVTEKGTGSAALPGTKFVYEQNVLKYVQQQKTDSTWYNTVSYSASKRRAGGSYYTKLNSKTVQNGFDATSPFYTSSTNSYSDDDSSVYDYVKKELIGYSETIVTDPDGNNTKRYTFQDGGRRGLLDRVEFYDNADHLYSKITYDYENYYENKVNNHSFENGLSGWTTHTGTGNVDDNQTARYADGDYSVHLNILGTTSTFSEPYIEQTVDLSSYATGQKIKLKCYIWKNGSGIVGQAEAQVLINGIVKYNSLIEQGFGDADLVEIDLTDYAGQSNVDIQFKIDLIATAGLASYYLDDVRIIPEDMSSYKPRVKTKKTWTYDGDSDFKIARTDFEYDDYGHVKKTTAYKGNSTDSSYQVYSYAYADVVYDLGEYIFGTAHTKTTDASGNIISEGWNYYDGSYDGTTYTGSYYVGETTALTKGRLTKTESRLTGDIGIAGNPKGYLQYDAYGNITKTWDANNHWASTTYDTTYHTFPNVVTNELFQSIQAQTYDAGTGNLLTATDANGQTTTNEYDSFGRIVKTYGPLTSSLEPLVKYEYKNDGTDGLSIAFPRYSIVKTRKDPYTTYSTLNTYTYIDGLGRAIQSKAPSETGWIEVNTIYNNRGMIDYTTTPKEVISSSFTASPDVSEKASYQYDCMGRITKLTKPDTKYVQTIYDDWTVMVIDEFADSSRFTKSYYDAFGRVVQVDQKNNYDGDGNGTGGDYTYTNYAAYHMHKQINNAGDYYPSVIESTDVKGNKSWGASDYLGRKVKTVDPDKGTWSYIYDANGNLTSQTDAKNQTITFTYDALNRLTTKDYPTGTDMVYIYDTGGAAAYALGRLRSVTDASGSAQMNYDKLGRITSDVKTITGLSAKTTSYTYDVMNRVNTTTYPDGEVVKNTYNSGGSLEMLGLTTDTDRYVKDIDYDAFGRTKYLLYGNNAYNNYTYYDSTGNYRLNNITAKQSDAATMMDYSYFYDSVGNITVIDAANNSCDQNFTYDFTGRLTAQTNAGFTGGTTSYTYDAIDRITYKNGVTYTYSEVDAGPHAVTSTSDGKSYTYDANGNMCNVLGVGDKKTILSEDFSSGLPVGWHVTQDSIWRGNIWTYNSFNKIMEIESSSFLGTVDSKLVTKSMDCSGNINTTLYFYEEWMGNGPFSGSWSDGYVYVSTNGGGNWTAVAHVHHCPPGEWLSGTQEIDISFVDGESDVRIAWRYNGLNDEHWRIDNVDVIGTFDVDTYNLSYDYDNRLTAVSGAITAEYTYDYAGNRVKKIENGVTNYYINQCYEVENGTEVKYYYANGQKIARNKGGALTFYHTDHLGSSSRITNSSGNEVKKIGYMPYGTDAYLSGTGDDPKYKFTGKEKDSTGLYYYNARWYDPETDG